MNEHPDLFSYPRAPGFKESTTSRDAARAIVPAAAFLRERVYQAFVAAGAQGLTADEAAAAIGAPERKHSVRSRVTELSKEKPPRLVLCQARRKNESGFMAKVWSTV